MKFRFVFILLILFVARFTGLAQPYATLDLYNEKPKQYQNRTLRSEKTGNKKFTAPKRLLQNGFTHYNYYFNANNKVTDVIGKAKAIYKDDYTQLLSFYNYTLELTAQNKGDIDSIIYKCTCGILLHDLQNDWIDNMYLTLGKAYMLRQQFDSAAYVFQYVNYSWAPNDEGYILPIGSNDQGNNNGFFTIASKEKSNIFKQLLSTPPSRNESFLWLSRNYIEQNKLGEAAGILSILQNDVNFPKRLTTDLHEMLAYLYYKQDLYDSAAFHLEKAMGNATNRFETARWQFLCAQMYQRTQKDSLSIRMFEKSIASTTDPMMEVFARLNIVRVAAATKSNALEENLSELYKLAKRDKYLFYKDIIYYAAAMLELQNNKPDAAKKDLQKSIEASVDNAEQKQRSFLLLADINYNSNVFQAAYNNYDSIQVATYLKEDEKNRVATRTPALLKITTNLSTIFTQDSLQKIAALPDVERAIYVKKVLRQLRKAEGLKDDNTIDFGSTGNSSFGNNDAPKADLFAATTSDFYFNNATLKQKGLSDFKIKWGNRPNTDNWRRQSALSQPRPNLNPMDVDDFNAPKATTADAIPNQSEVKDLSFEGLMSKLPLTADRKEKSDSLIAKALFNNGTIFQNELQSFPQAIASFEELNKRFGKHAYTEQTLFNLIFCYKKTGDLRQSDSCNALLKSQFPKGKYTHLAFAGNAIVRENDSTTAATDTYQHIYNLFAQNRFEEAKAAKEKADQQFGKSFWTPQLLYIEALYYAKTQQDTLAMYKLQDLVKAVPNTELAKKADNMLYVLQHRQKIEAYLQAYNEERKEDIVEKRIDLDTLGVSQKEATAFEPPVLAKDILNTSINPNFRVINNGLTVSNKIFQFVSSDPHYVAAIFKNRDDAFNEAKNAFDHYNKETFYNDKIAIDQVIIDDHNKFILFGPFPNVADAIDYLDKIKLQAPVNIIQWIPTYRYRFTVISSPNLEILKTNKDAYGYTNFIKEIFPDKF